MSWDTDTHNDQNDHAEGVLPLYAGVFTVGEAAVFTVNGRHNAMRWHEFSNPAALVAEPLAQYTAAQHDEDDDGDHEETGSEYISRIDGAEAVLNA